MKSSVFILLLFCVPSLSAEGLVVGAPELTLVEWGGEGASGMNGTQWFAVLWLSVMFGIAALPAVTRNRVRLDWLAKDMPFPRIPREFMGALWTPIAVVVWGLIFLFSGLMALPWNVSAAVVVAFVLGAWSLLLVQRPLGQRADAVGADNAGIAFGVSFAIAELGNIGLIVFLSVLVPFEASAVCVLVFALGQALCARLNLGEAGTYDRLKTHSVHQGLLLASIVYVIPLIFDGSPLIAAELFFVMLLMRLVVSVVPLLAELTTGNSHLEGGDASVVRDWCGTVIAIGLVVLAALVGRLVFPAGAFSMHGEIWWALAAVIGAGSVARVLGVELTETLARHDPHMSRIAVGSMGILGIWFAAEICGSEPFQFLLSGVAHHHEWMFAFVLFVFGWTLTQGMAARTGAFQPALLAFAVSGVLVFGEVFTEAQKHFSLMNSKVFASLAAGFLLIALMRWADSVSGCDQPERARSLTKYASAALGLVLIQICFAVALPLFSVFGAFAAFAVVAFVDSMDPSPASTPSRHGAALQILLGWIGAGISIELLRVFGGAEGGWVFGFNVGVIALKNILGVVLLVGGMCIGFMIAHRCPVSGAK